MPLDPQIEALLAALDAQGAPPFDRMTVEEARAAAKGFVDMQGEPVEVADVREVTVPVDGGEIGVTVYRPDVPGPRPLTVYLHGGGWVIGGRDVVDRPCRALAAAAGAVVAAVGYRLAPEHPFPTPLEDAYAAVTWLAEHAAELGASDELVVAGDSAGGNLAAAVTLLARGRGGPRIARQVLVYPVVAPVDAGFPSYTENGEGLLLTAGSMRWFWNHYHAGANPGDNPLAVPLHATDLTDLPPAYIAVCEFDPLRDEGTAYAQRLREAGVPVVLRRVDGAIHGILWMAGVLDLGRELLDDVAAAVRGARRPADPAARRERS